MLAAFEEGVPCRQQPAGQLLRIVSPYSFDNQPMQWPQPSRCMQQVHATVHRCRTFQVQDLQPFDGRPPCGLK